MSIRHLIAAMDLQWLYEEHETEDGRPVKLSPSHKLALAAVADDASDKTDHSFPGLEKVQKWAGVGKRRALELIQDLTAATYLESIAAGFPGKRAVYKVNIPKAGAIASAEMAPEPVDNSQIMGAESRTSQIMGAEIRENARDLAPLSLDPLLIKQSPRRTTTESVDNSSVGDDQDSDSPKLGLLARRRQRKIGRELDHNRIFAHAATMLADIPEVDRRRIATMLAFAVLAYPAAKGESVTAPTAYVLRAFENDPFVWQKRGMDMWAES